MADNSNMGMNLGMSGNPFLGQNNPYLQNTIDSTMGDMARGYNLLVKPQQETSMINSGSFGNSGLQQIQQNALNDQAKSMGQAANNMRMQDYNQQQQMYQWDQNFNKSVYDTTFNQQQQQLQNVQGLLGTMNNYNQQDIKNATDIQNTPMNYWQNFTNAANGIGSGYASSTSTQNMPGNTAAGVLGGGLMGWKVGQSLFGGGGGGGVPYNNQTTIPMQPGGGY